MIDAESVPGVWVESGFVPTPATLYADLERTAPWDQRKRSRRTASFGVPYNYSGITYPVAPIPDLLVPLVDRLADSLGFRPNNCLANHYPDGDAAMGFHADATGDLEPGTGIAVVSLGAERAITFRSQTDRTAVVEYSLASGSLLYMTAGVQAAWKHAIRPHPGVGGRISLTFRRLGGGGRLGSPG